MHQEAHGNTALKIIEVMPDLADAFMGASDVAENGAVLQPLSREYDTGTRTVLFTDIVGSTSLTQRLGDDAAMTMVGVHDSIVRAALAGENGREVKHTGDGIMAAFFSAASAIRCGIKVQEDLWQHRAEHPDLPLRVRVGIAAGEPIERHRDLFGSTVQLAARLCAHADPDSILISNAVAELCAGKGLRLQSVGRVVLKGFDEPLQVTAWKFRWCSPTDTSFSDAPHPTRLLRSHREPATAAASPRSVMNSRCLIASNAGHGHHSCSNLSRGRPRSCPLWVISGLMRCKRACPLYPQ